MLITNPIKQAIDWLIDARQLYWVMEDEVRVVARKA